MSDTGPDPTTDPRLAGTEIVDSVIDTIGQTPHAQFNLRIRG